MKKLIYALAFVLFTFVNLNYAYASSVTTDENCALVELYCSYGNFVDVDGTSVSYEMASIQYKDGVFTLNGPGSSPTISDGFNINSLQSNGSYFCPSNVVVYYQAYGTRVISIDPDDYKIAGGQVYDLISNDSHITCDSNKSLVKSCPYRYDYNDATFVTIELYSDGTLKYSLGSLYNDRNNISLDIDADDLGNCNDLYIKGNTITNNSSSGKKLVKNDKEIDGGELLESTKILSGEKYKELMCDVKSNLLHSTTQSLINQLPAIDKKGTKITSLSCNSNICGDGSCKGNEEYLLTQSLKAVLQYCSNEVYDLYGDTTVNLHSMQERMDECIQFQNFLNEGADLGIFENSLSGCDFVTNDLLEKLVWVLDIIKIAGPILALGLGTLDFIKVLAAGDADKELKNAFKRFSIRIVAAILLFIVPVLLAFLMDIFLGNQDGYNTDNPFCNLVEWDD